MDRNDTDKRKYVRMLDEVNNGDLPFVGGKNASLGEMIQGLSNADIHVPNGFATTIDPIFVGRQHNILKTLIAK